MLRRAARLPATIHSFSSPYSRSITDLSKPSVKPADNVQEPPQSSPDVSPLTDPSGPSQTNSSPYALHSLKDHVRRWSESTAIAVRRRTDEVTSRTSVTFSRLGSQLNHVTGYEEIEALKRQAKIKATRQASREAKTAYDDAAAQRSVSQREVNDLLQRKSNWSDGDVSRFTSLVRQDHLYEQDEARAKARVEETEDAVEREFSELMRSILARYHEEQVWSDKIRSASTYGSLAVLGLNLAVFLLAIAVVEPWKRRRLAQTFEKKIEEMNEENATMLNGAMQHLADRFVGQEKLFTRMMDASQKKAVEERARSANTEENALALEALATPAHPPNVVSGRELLFITTSAIAGGFMVYLRSILGSR
ncbi:hypothetical protein SERLA73DRAFT_56573 [Serpula lacrymans var. lacrymans S7.3]|uniref:Sensitive to high expression protein 9, mitochondrial n=1 Tax=Serpula lacrymans var. lacrymans (strain S7.3) TaxID=936435 RepID=F8Q149_SERL3|nr:hypothetical protein SERLA73DRAFT_56573 [Serpula lacrymans var. lacrymans S7.3]